MMLALAREHSLVPEEIMSTNGKTAKDIILHQVLVYNVAHQWIQPPNGCFNGCVSVL